MTSRLRPLFRPLKNQLTFRGMAIAKFCNRAKGPLRIWALLAAKLLGEETVHAAVTRGFLEERYLARIAPPKDWPTRNNRHFGPTSFLI